MGELTARFKFTSDRVTFACPGEDEDKQRGQLSRTLLEKRVRSYMSLSLSSDLFRRVRTDLNNLQILKLGGFDLGDRGAWVLGKALAANESLLLLDLGFNGITDKGIEQVAHALEKNRALRTLYLSGNGIGVDGAAKLATALRTNTTLRALYLSGNGIADEGVRHLAEMLHVNTTLHALYLGTNNLGSTGMMYIADALGANAHLEELMLSQNQIQSAGIQYLVDAFASSTLHLQTLEMGFNSIDAAGAIALADVLQSCPNRLENLYLDNNPIGDAGAAALGQCVAANATLRVLDLSYAHLSLLGLRDLSVGLRQSTSLMGLLLDGHDWASTKHMERPPPNVTSLSKVDALQYAAKCIVQALQTNPGLPLIKLTGVNLGFAPGLNMELPEALELTAPQPLCALNERILEHVRTMARVPPPSQTDLLLAESRKVLSKIAALSFDTDELKALCAYYCADLLNAPSSSSSGPPSSKRRRLSMDVREGTNGSDCSSSGDQAPAIRVGVYPQVEKRLRALVSDPEQEDAEMKQGVLTVLRQLHYLVKALQTMENAPALIETLLGSTD
ncbi:Aste57867_9366 [Aphanomyces stellatus]|uniref:Aste57867_9366 protein n=1 Tax=Aphanomyces stellatus TaxID=120398 RepID=A0A485KMP6_9STRA|nr:hypothetical protein As57867_009330 [Aphanomyces stellatus]VFT86247.1 Aste57867_9366 [Aphanomyces stellatus]